MIEFKLSCEAIESELSQRNWKFSSTEAVSSLLEFLVSSSKYNDYVWKSTYLIYFIIESSGCNKTYLSNIKDYLHIYCTDAVSVQEVIKLENLSRLSNLA